MSSANHSPADNDARPPEGVAPATPSDGRQRAMLPRRRRVASAASGMSRANKIYRTPVTPPPARLHAKEEGFTLDCVAVASICSDYSGANPKLGPVVPPFNSQHEPHSRRYFRFIGVDNTLRRTGQQNGGTSIEGLPTERFHNSGHGYRYLSARNAFGAGHSRETIDGHSQFMQNIKPVIGYNGLYGYRRNNPWLRAHPSSFGVISRSPAH